MGSPRATSRGERLAAASPYLLAGLLGAAGVAHFAVSEPYARIVPARLPAQTELVYLSGVAELACAAGLVARRTRRRAGYATAALFVAVWPANVSMALAAGSRPTLYTAVVWLRLPLQLPLIAWALSLARRPARP